MHRLALCLPIVLATASPPRPPPTGRNAPRPPPRLILDLVRTVPGDRVEAVGVVGPDADPHEYQPTAEDARNLTRADLIFANGLGLEAGWLPALAKNARTSVPVVELARAPG